MHIYTCRGGGGGGGDKPLLAVFIPHALGEAFARLRFRNVTARNVLHEHREKLAEPQPLLPAQLRKLLFS